MIDPGELRHRFILERPVQSADGQGGYAETWEEVSRPWGSFNTPKPREGDWGQGLVGSVLFQVRIRWRAGVTQSMRLRLGERTFSIEGPPRDLLDRREFLELSCREVSP